MWHRGDAESAHVSSICAWVKPRELRKHVTTLQREIAMTKGTP
jgi:hypothetical protein